MTGGPKRASATPRVAVLIDGVAINRICRALQAHVDFRRLRAIFSEREILTQISYYAVTPPPDEHFPHRTLLDWLVYNGYTVREKVGKQRTTREGQSYFRGSMAVEMTVDAMDIAASVEHLVLVPGEDDFTALADAIQRKGVRFTVLSTIKGDTNIILSRVRRCADEFIEFADLLPRIVARGKG
jgi:uncharacterized LabA/DUF88 family protein